MASDPEDGTPEDGRSAGALTFLFTDIVGSTPLWESNPDGMNAALERHDAIVRAAVEGHGGEIVKTTGDGVHAVFASPAAAVTATIEIQRQIAAVTWDPRAPIAVRAGLHTGESRFRGGDYYGATLNRAARIMSLGHGGQILISAATYELLKNTPGFELRALGEHRLKGIRTSERIFQVAHPDLEASFPPLASAQAVPNNLPLQATEFVGRDREIADLTNRLQSARLLTLLGPGGAGKTRLALRLADELLDRFPDGVYFVDLSALRDGALIPDAIAEPLEIKEVATEPLRVTLGNALATRKTLLVLDNFEQLVASAPIVRDLLAAAPGLAVLVTSREVLHLSGEQVHPVPPLDLPDPDADLEAIAAAEGVRLFVRRAQAADPAFALTKDNAAAVAAVCRQLDGLPLAIELAAARVRMFTPKKLQERLSDRLAILTGGARDRSERQRSLRGAIDWSYELLDPAERTLFARLEVFSGGMSIEAVEAVCAHDLPIDVLDGLESLLDKSLIGREEDFEGEPRFTLLETLQAYARERHRQQPDWRDTLAAHARWTLDLAERAEDGMFGDTPNVWVERLRTDEGNLRAVLLRCQAGELGPASAEHGVRLTGALRYYWEATAKLGEGLSWLEGALTRSTHLGTDLRAKALCGAGVLAYWRGDAELGDRYCQLALDAGEAIGDPVITGEAQHFLAHVAQQRGEAARAVALLTASHKTFQDLGHRWGTRRSRICLADAHRLIHDFDCAERNLAAAIAEQRAEGNDQEMIIAMLLSNYGNVLNRQGRLDQAAASFREGLGIARALKNEMLSAYLIDGLAGTAVLGGHPEEAAVRMGAADAIFKRLGVEKMAAIDQADHDVYLDAIRAALAPDVFDRLWQQGRALSTDAAMTRAVTDIS